MYTIKTSYGAFVKLQPNGKDVDYCLLHNSPIPQYTEDEVNDMYIKFKSKCIEDTWQVFELELVRTFKPLLKS